MVKTLTKGNPMKLIVQFTLPLLFGNLFQQAYNMADAAIVGQTLGADALGAVGSSSSVQFLVLGFCIGIASGFAIPIANAFGAGKEKEMRRYIWNGWVITGVTAVILTIVTALFCHTIITLLKSPAEIFSMSYTYLLVIFLGIPCTLLYNYTSSILRAVGDSRTPFLFLAFSSVLNIGLDFFCILVMHWGVGGAAFATIFSQGLSGFLCLHIIHKKYPVLQLSKEDKVIDKEHLQKMIGMGFPMGLQYSITAIGCMVMQASNNNLGTTYVSGYAAGSKIYNLMECPVDALATAVCTFVSQNYGYGDSARIKEGLKVGGILGVGWAIIAGILLNTVSRSMAAIFVSSDNTAVIDACVQYLSTVGKFYIVLCLLIVYRYSTQGLGWSGRAIFSGVFEMIARIIASILLVPRLGYTAICFEDPIAWICADCYILPMCYLAMKHAANDIAARKALPDHYKAYEKA